MATLAATLAQSSPEPSCGQEREGSGVDNAKSSRSSEADVKDFFERSKIIVVSSALLTNLDFISTYSDSFYIFVFSYFIG